MIVEAESYWRLAMASLQSGLISQRKARTEMTGSGPSSGETVARDWRDPSPTLTQWQGPTPQASGNSRVDFVRHREPGHAMSSAVLKAVPPPNEGAVAVALVTFSDEGLEKRRRTDYQLTTR